MMPKNEVFCADCLPALRNMPDKSFSLCVADPPYGINVTGRHRERERERDSHRRRHRTPIRGKGQLFMGRPKADYQA